MAAIWMVWMIGIAQKWVWIARLSGVSAIQLRQFHQLGGSKPFGELEE